MLVNYFKKYPYVLIIIIVIIIWATINGIQADSAQKELAQEGVFTIATIKDIKGSHGRWVVVEFEYNGNNYETESRNNTIPKSWIGEKIFIKFLPSRPTEFECYEQIRVPDSLKTLFAPIWTKLPVDTTNKQQL